MPQTLLVGTWADGVHVIAGGFRSHELAGQSVRGLVRDAEDRVVALVGGHKICRRRFDERAGVQWETLATCEQDLACCFPVRGALLVGTDSEAALLRFDDAGVVSRVGGFDAVPGRSSWYAGQAVVDGRTVGPPLGIRAMAHNADRSVTLAAVHVGGAPRSVDNGATWHPTFAVDWDVHEVAAHSERPELFAAATAEGLAISGDAGESWALHTNGLHAPYCSAVTFVGDQVFVAASEHHFAPRGAIYRGSLQSTGGGDVELTLVGGGLPPWLGGIVDTACIASSGNVGALVDASGQLFVSEDSGNSWTLRAEGVTESSCILIV